MPLTYYGNIIVGLIPKMAAAMNATLVYAGYPCGRVRRGAQLTRILIAEG